MDETLRTICFYGGEFGVKGLRTPPSLIAMLEADRNVLEEFTTIRSSMKSTVQKEMGPFAMTGSSLMTESSSFCTETSFFSTNFGWDGTSTCYDRVG